MAGTRKTAAKAEEPVVHAQGISLTIERRGKQWFAYSKNRPEVGERKLTVEEAAEIVSRRPSSLTHYEGLPGGEEFDALVDGNEL